MPDPATEEEMVVSELGFKGNTQDWFQEQGEKRDQTTSRCVTETSYYWMERAMAELTLTAMRKIQLERYNVSALLLPYRSCETLTAAQKQGWNGRGSMASPSPSRGCCGAKGQRVLKT